MLILLNFSMRNQKNFINFIIVLMMSSGAVFAANGKMPINDTEIRLSDGRMIEAVRCGVHCHCLVVKRAEKTLRKQCYQEEFGRLWDYAFFVPVKLGQYVADVNGDGNFEIGIATWDGGNNIIHRTALAFTLRGDKLVYFGQKKFNLEYGEYLYE